MLSITKQPDNQAREDLINIQKKIQYYLIDNCSIVQYKCYSFERCLGLYIPGLISCFISSRVVMLYSFFAASLAGNTTFRSSIFAPILFKIPTARISVSLSARPIAYSTGHLKYFRIISWRDAFTLFTSSISSSKLHLYQAFWYRKTNPYNLVHYLPFFLAPFHMNQQG